MDLTWCGSKPPTAAYSENLREETLRNNHFRKVVYTDEYIQIVIYVLLPGQKIDNEKHDASQLCRIEEGKLQVWMGDNGRPYAEGEAPVIPPNVLHKLKNLSDRAVRFNVVYSPPQHKHGIVQDYPYSGPSPR